MTVSILGMEIDKNSCSVVGVDNSGVVVTVRRTMRPQTLIIMSAISRLASSLWSVLRCSYLGRLFLSQGHEVRLMSPEYVRPHVKAQKNDDLDAEGIAEAASRPTMRFAELTSEAQLDVQSLHRVQSRLVAERTTLINQMRAIDLVFAAGRCKFESALDTFFGFFG